MNNLKIAFRNLLKSKTVTLINLFGLTLGMVVTVLLLSYVRQEKDTDTFIKDYEDIYLFTQDKEHTAVYMSRLMVALLRERFLDIPITYAANDWAGQIFLADNTGNRGRKELVDIIKKQKQEGMTCILITHFMEEAAEFTFCLN